jgi:hypothetical protein
MKKVIVLSLLLMFGAYAQAQTTCDSNTHFDNNGHVCTNLVATGTGQNFTTGLLYRIVAQDGIQEGPNYTWPGLPMEFNAAFTGNNAQVALGMPFDPFLLNNPYGYTESVLETNWTVFPAFTQTTVWSGKVGLSSYQITTVEVAPLYESVDSCASSAAACGQSWTGSWVQSVTFAGWNRRGCVAVTRWCHPVWSYGPAYGEFSSSAVALP